MVTSTTLKKLLSGGFTLGGLNVRIYRRTFPSPIKYSEISWVGFTNRPSKVGISEGTFQRSWFRVERDLRKPTDQRKSLEAEHWQLNSRYREGYDRHDTVKGTRESVNTPVRHHGQEQYRKYGAKEKQEVINHTKTIQESKTGVEFIPWSWHRTAQLQRALPPLHPWLQAKFSRHRGGLSPLRKQAKRKVLKSASNHRNFRRSVAVMKVSAAETKELHARKSKTHIFLTVKNAVIAVITVIVVTDIRHENNSPRC